MLYTKYSNPKEFMHLYMDQGRFGEFVTEILLSEQRRKEEQAEKESEDRLWNIYLHSYSDKSFAQWKAELIEPDDSGASKPLSMKTDADLTNDDVDAIVKRLFNH